MFSMNYISDQALGSIPNSSRFTEAENYVYKLHNSLKTD